MADSSRPARPPPPQKAYSSPVIGSKQSKISLFVPPLAINLIRLAKMDPHSLMYLDGFIVSLGRIGNLLTAVTHWNLNRQDVHF